MQKVDENLKLIGPFHHRVNPKMFNKIYINLILYYINSSTPKKIFILY